jgi:hypothetical protein
MHSDCISCMEMLLQGNDRPETAVLGLMCALVWIAMLECQVCWLACCAP